MGFDNPELVEIIVKLVGAIIGVFLFLCFARGVNNEDVKPLSFPDRFDIGYIDDPPPQVVVVEKQVKPKRKKKQQPKKVVPQKTTEKSCQDDQLRQDCVDALVALGTKRGEARRAAAQCLAANPQIKTVNEFIPIVFKRN